VAYNILIVDDSAITREVMARTCRMSGIDLGEIYQAANGQEALDLLNNKWADIIFADINMPVMDGIELVEQLRKRDEWEQVPVVIVSTEGSKTRMEELRQMGISGYIRKPFTPEQVSEIMHQVMGEHHV
jgi:two-component system, chemotaxis family, chemotaxis protein CheY